MTMAEDGFSTDYAIMGEATENDIAVACRGRIGIEVVIRGKSVHASISPEGFNPFEFLGPFLIALKRYEGISSPRYGSSLLTPTKILSSEAGTNVVPNWVRLSLDYRSIPGETNASVVEQLRRLAEDCAIPGISVDIMPATIPVQCYTGMTGEGLMGEPAFGIDEDDDAVKVSKTALEEVYGRPVPTKPWAFATDSGHFAQKGVKVIGFSPAEIKKCHTVEDNIRLDMLKEGVIGYLALTRALCG
jgi:acetylornithine deacetylase/succinyl-diaminopimelate desuccinylase-like protein